MRLKTMLITLSLLFVLTVGVGFATDLVVVVNDQKLINEEFYHIESDVVYGGLVVVAEKHGYEVTWNEMAQMAYLNIDGHFYGFEIGSAVVLDQMKLVEMSSPTVAVDGRMFVPMDYLAEIMGFEVERHTLMPRVIIKSDVMEFEPEELGDLPPLYEYTEEDLLWLARIVDIEARDGSVVKKTAVANVVLNRVADPRFPNTIYEVIFQKGQFPPAYYSSFATLEPKEESFTAAKNALMGEVIIEDALYFNYIPFKSKSDDFIRNIEGDYFYY
jgi:hypothetical protein